MTLMALIFANRGGKVLTNYNIQHKNARKIEFPEFISLLLKGRTASKELLILDELPTWIDSRASMAKTSRFATYFIDQSAKLGYDVVFSSQRSMRADIEFRELCDQRYRAKKDEKNKVFLYDILNPEVYDRDLTTGKTLKLPYASASRFWNRYDTYEAVKPVGIEALLAEIQKHNPAWANSAINKQTNTLYEKLELFSLHGITPTTVKNALLSLELPTTYAQYVHLRLLHKLSTKTLENTQTKTLQPQVPSKIEAYKKKWRLDQAQKLA